MHQLARITLLSAAISACAGAFLLCTSLPKRPATQARSLPHPPSESAEPTKAMRHAEDGAVIAAALARVCAGSTFVVLSTSPANPTEDSVPHEGAFGEAKQEMLERSPAYFGESAAAEIGNIIPPPNCPSIAIATDQAIETAIAAAFQRQRTLSRNWGPLGPELKDAESVLRISLPGYSRDGAHAVIYTNISCGGLCGSGSSVELAKIDGVWKVVRSLPAWIS